MIDLIPETMMVSGIKSIMLRKISESETEPTAKNVVTG